MSEILINGHQWSDATVKMHGRIVDGITAINYGTKQVKENHFGAGNKATRRGRGNKDCSGSVTLYLDEVALIKAGLPRGKDLTDIAPFDINISYFNESNILVTNTLKQCEYLNDDVDTKQGDTKIEIKLDLIIGSII